MSVPSGARTADRPAHPTRRQSTTRTHRSGGTAAGNRAGRWTAWLVSSSLAICGGRTWSYPSERQRSCGPWCSRCSTATACTSSGDLLGTGPTAWASAPCSLGRPAPARPWRRESLAVFCSSTCTISISAPLSANTSGETEKNLEKIFQLAESSGAILLFDEADALFGKRSKVNDSRDRYANLEISYLLQRMESYAGLSILTTNLKSSMDDAFVRRLRFIVQFPFPGAAQRAAIWRRIFPVATPTPALDYEGLAGIELPGGAIRNIALTAAFHAAGDGGVVTMAHLREATREEFGKLDRTLREDLVKDW